MRIIFLQIVVLVCAGLAVWYILGMGGDTLEPEQVQEATSENTDGVKEQDISERIQEPAEVVVTDLDIPWDLVFLPDGSMLVTERAGRLIHIESGTVYPIDGVVHTGEAGLLGIALHPQFSTNRYVYLYQTTEVAGGLANRVARYTYQNEILQFDRIIFDAIPGAQYHDGGRIAFGPDGFLYITVGDTGAENAAQDTSSFAGSILRITDEGTIPDDNPFGNAIYSYGHRNPQGLSWDDQRRLWSTEHGRSGILSGYDEVNMIEIGGNYGWPESQGNDVEDNTIGPRAHSGPDTTWAPASALWFGGSLYFGGLRGEALYEAVIENDEVVEVREHLKGEYGRIRSVVLGPDGYLYLTTSNRDGRGSPDVEDDRIIKVDPSAL